MAEVAHPALEGVLFVAVRDDAQAAFHRKLVHRLLTDVSVRGKYVAFLAGQTCTIAGKKLEPWFSTQEVGSATQVQACTNGAAYLVSGRSALRVLP